MMGAKGKREVPDLSALLGGAAAVAAVSGIDGNAQEIDMGAAKGMTAEKQKKQKLVRSSVMMSKEQYENMRLLTWYLRKSMTELWGEALSGLEEKYAAELEKAHHEYSAAGRPNLEFRGRR